MNIWQQEVVFLFLDWTVRCTATISAVSVFSTSCVVLKSSYGFTLQVPIMNSVLNKVTRTQYDTFSTSIKKQVQWQQLNCKHSYKKTPPQKSKCQLKHEHVNWNKLCSICHFYSLTFVPVLIFTFISVSWRATCPSIEQYFFQNLEKKSNLVLLSLCLLRSPPLHKLHKLLLFESFK